MSTAEPPPRRGVQPRLTLYLCGAVGMAILFWVAFGGLAPFGSYPGPYGDALLAVAVGQRHVLNVVTAVNFDYRGLDTLGEEFILFAAVAGVVLLLRAENENTDPATAPETKRHAGAGNSEAVRWQTLRIAPITMLFGLYVVLLGHLSVGGGFQGGTIMSSTWLLTYFTGGRELLEKVSKKIGLELADSGGAGMYALIGLITMLTGGAFLQNTFPLGTTGQIASAGTIPLINFGVGIEVAAGFAMLLSEFVQNADRVRKSSPEDQK